MKKYLLTILIISFLMPLFAQFKTEVFNVNIFNPGNIYEDTEGRIWFYPRMFMSGNIAMFDDGEFINYDKKSAIVSNMQSLIIEDAENNLWFAGVGLSKFDGKDWKQWTQKDELPTFLVSYLYIDENDELQVFNSKFFYGGEYGKFQNEKYKTNRDIPMVGAVSCILEDSKGNFWYGGWKDGIYLRQGDKWTNYSNEIGFKWVTSIVEDNSGNIWAFGLEGNHAVFKNGIWKSFKYGKGYFSSQSVGAFVLGILPGFVAAYVIEDKESIPEVVLNDDEIWTLIRKRGIIIHKNNEMIELHEEMKADFTYPKKITDMVKDSEGNIWILNSKGYLAKFDGSSWEFFKDDFPVGYNAFFIDSNGNKWIAGPKKIIKLTD